MIKMGIAILIDIGVPKIIQVKHVLNQVQTMIEMLHTMTPREDQLRTRIGFVGIVKRKDFGYLQNVTERLSGIIIL